MDYTARAACFQWPLRTLFVPGLFPGLVSVILALMSVPGPPPIRFGVFELRIRSGELLRKGSKVNLQEQPFQALVLLLSIPANW